MEKLIRAIVAYWGARKMSGGRCGCMTIVLFICSLLVTGLCISAFLKHCYNSVIIQFLALVVLRQ